MPIKTTKKTELPKSKVTWMGRPIQEMTKPQLTEALRQIADSKNAASKLKVSK